MEKVKRLPVSQIPPASTQATLQQAAALRRCSPEDRQTSMEFDTASLPQVYVTGKPVEASRSKKAFGKNPEAEAKKAEAGAKQATAKAELQGLGKQIAARVKIMRDYDAAAEEKAGYELRKAQDERDTIHNVLLVQARTKCKEAGESFEKFRKRYCPDLSRSRLYAVLAIADGRKTVEQDRAEKRESVAKSRAKASSTSAVGDTPGLVAGNDVDTEASAEARKAAASEPEPRDPAATPAEAPAPLTKEEISDDALTTAKEYWRKEIAPKISEDDYRRYRLFISDERQCMPGHRTEAA